MRKIDFKDFLQLSRILLRVQCKNPNMSLVGRLKRISERCEHMIKIRLWGKLEELEQSKQELEKCFKVLFVSQPYKDRGQSEYYRLYVEVELRDK